METYAAIAARRSIRKFNEKEIPKEIVEKILTAGMLAPSAKNQQPWQFIVVTNKEKTGMLNAMAAGLANTKANNPRVAQLVGSAEYSMKIMAQAPVTVFVINPKGCDPWKAASGDLYFLHSGQIQSVGAAIENMILAATDMGLGSLWICDVFFAYHALCDWLGEPGELMAAISFGYAEESPAPRPRKAFDDVVVWR